MSVVAAWLAPHPPLIFPEVGRGKQNEISATSESYRRMADEIAAFAPDTVVVVSPHAQMYSDYIHISPGDSADGDMKAYGVGGVRVHAVYDAEFVTDLARECEEEGFPAGTLGERNKALDHGTSIPVRFINEAYDRLGHPEAIPKVVRAGISGLSAPDHYHFGQLIEQVSTRLGRRTILIASGDLSHKLSDEGPYGYAPEGPEFDRIICETAKDADFSRLFEMPEAFCEKAGECGARPLFVMAGALDRKAVDSRLYSYEGPFGVGYGIASFAAAGEDETRAFLDKYLAAERQRAGTFSQSESPHVALARKTIENFVKTGRIYKAPEPLPEVLTSEKAGVFVSIKKHGQLRGCIGTIAPVTESIGEEIRANAVSAATRDPRFSAIEEDELPYLEYSVDVLAPAEPVASADLLDPSKYGVIVSLGGKRGLLLPDLEGIEDAQTQIGIAMRKAGIADKDRSRVKIERFEVIRFK